jgi:hypothetical protein
MAARKRAAPKRGKSSGKPRTKKADAVSEISRKMDRLERKIDLLRRQSEKTEDDVEESLQDRKDADKDIEGIEDDVQKMEKDIDKMEEAIFQIGKITIGREHVMELARGAAGAFLGVGIGLGVRWMPGIAANLEWIHAASVLVFIFMVGSLLVWKNEREWIAKQGNWFIPKRLIHLFIISIGVEIVALSIFNMLPLGLEDVIKTLIVGSYPAMSGAITFTIT